MCVFSRLIFTVCGHVQSTEEPCKSEGQRKWVWNKTCRVKTSRIEYGFCPECVTYYHAWNTWGVDAILNYWEYKNMLGFNKASHPSWIPRNILLTVRLPSTPVFLPESSEFLTLKEAFLAGGGPVPKDLRTHVLKILGATIDWAQTHGPPRFLLPPTEQPAQSGYSGGIQTEDDWAFQLEDEEDARITSAIRHEEARAEVLAIRERNLHDFPVELDPSVDLRAWGMKMQVESARNPSEMYDDHNEEPREGYQIHQETYDKLCGNDPKPSGNAPGNIPSGNGNPGASTRRIPYPPYPRPPSGRVYKPYRPPPREVDKTEEPKSETPYEGASPDDESDGRFGQASSRHDATPGPSTRTQAHSPSPSSIESRQPGRDLGKRPLSSSNLLTAKITFTRRKDDKLYQISVPWHPLLGAYHDGDEFSELDVEEFLVAARTVDPNPGRFEQTWQEVVPSSAEEEAGKYDQSNSSNGKSPELDGQEASPLGNPAPRRGAPVSSALRGPSLIKLLNDGTAKRQTRPKPPPVKKTGHKSDPSSTGPRHREIAATPVCFCVELGRMRCQCSDSQENPGWI